MPTSPPELPPEIRDSLARYEPLLASDEHAPLIRDLAAWYRPRTRREAEVIASIVSAYVYLAERTGLPVDSAYLCDPSVVEAYGASDQDWADHTRRNARTMLHRIVRQRPGPHAYDKPPPLPPLGKSTQYTPAQVDALLLWAAGQPRPARRHAVLSILVLSLGAGLAPSDIRAVRGTDIARDPATDAVLVHVRRDQPRHVPFLARYEQDALDLAAAAGTGWLVRPDRDPEQARRTGNLLRYEFDQAQPPTDGTPIPNVAGCRHTWLVHHLQAGVRLDVLTEAAGYADAQQIASLVGFMRDRPAPADAIAQLRGAPGPDLS